MDRSRPVARDVPLAIRLDRSRGLSLQTQLYLGIKALIQESALHPGDTVPSSRALADALRVSRNTAIGAYDRLLGEGYLDARPRSGLFVNDTLGGFRPPAAALAPTTSTMPPPSALRSPALGRPLPFRPCQPDTRLFPLALWNRLRGRCLRASGTSLLDYQSQLPLGLPALRQALASYLRDRRGVTCDWHQVAITTGSQQALFMLAHLLLEPGDAVLMEDPGYLGARLAWQRAGAAIQPQPVDDFGLIPPAPEEPVPHVLYSTPSRQFPTGACLPLARRLALIGVAARANAWLIEDDYDSEFRYAGPPLPSLQSLDGAGHVIYVGSMSKILFPSLRIGYAVLPDILVEPFTALRTVQDDHGPLIDQAALAEFIASGALHTHVRRCRREYGERLGTFLAVAAAEGLPLTFPHTDGGMNVAGLLPGDYDDAACARALASHGLEVPPLSRYALNVTPPGLLFGFSAFDSASIRDALSQVARILEPDRLTPYPCENVVAATRS